MNTATLLQAGAVLCVAALQAAPTSADAQCPSIAPEVRDVLVAMAGNAQRVDYSGIVTLQRGSDMQIVEVSHKVVEGTATEQLSRLTGQDARVRREAHPITCLHPGQELLRAQLIPDGAACGLGAVYEFRLGPGERIAGREALRLRVEPRDMYRYGYVFELDRDTALMLKATTFAEDQRVLEQFQFASLQVEAQSAHATALVHEAGHPHPQENAAAETGPAWDISWLPGGFLATDAAPVVAQRKSYTDGLASFSVFLEPLGASIQPGEGLQREGSTVAYTRGVVLEQRPVLITVIGEIPINTARMVADSVRLR